MRKVNLHTFTSFPSQAAPPPPTAVQPPSWNHNKQTSPMNFSVCCRYRGMTGREGGKTTRRSQEEDGGVARGVGGVERRRKDEGQGCGGGKWFILQPR